jgi:hypothetical protein
MKMQNFHKRNFQKQINDMCEQIYKPFLEKGLRKKVALRHKHFPKNQSQDSTLKIFTKNQKKSRLRCQEKNQKSANLLLILQK